jgi:hypothetical protein
VRTFFVADTDRGDGKRSVVHADEKLTAFMELESVICSANPLTIRVGNDSRNTLGRDATDVGSTNCIIPHWLFIVVSIFLVLETALLKNAL